MRSHEEYKEMLSAHALGTLEAEEARELEAYVTKHTDLRDELKEWRETVSLLAYAAPVTEPSNLVRERLFANLRPQKESSFVENNSSQSAKNVIPFPVKETRRSWNAIQTVTAIAASIVIVFLAALLWMTLQSNRANRAEIAKLKEQVAQERYEKSIIFSSWATTMDLKGTETAPDAKARFIFHSKTGEGIFYAEHLPAPPVGKAYQLWYITDPKKPVPGKTFKPETDGRIILSEQVPIRGNIPSTFAVTIEDEKGATSPTGAMYLISS